MNSIKLKFLHNLILGWRRFLGIFLLLTSLLFVDMHSALADINNDRYDGNIFVVYAGNGSLVPPKVTLGQALAAHKPTLLAFYVDDSSDCKEYAVVISRVQESYGREVEIIPVTVDGIVPKKTYSTTEPGYYYSGGVPQVVVFNKSGQVVLNKKGQVPYEQIDDKFREVFDLLPRNKSVQLKRRSFNEFNSELTQ
ncbi:thylakoid membrane photosystem I accumulation factor [Aetokthonos hydrillicola Thurmond2011]|jgi:thiol-disulfide isomerase/thioredoxin|uniref:Thylakoid membrane photosystem I accumulation factor n=1 Tax=Aetokthonos hydrillicola Thurmond2011 TaxID=2712845 RepID=A0AAP5I7Z1_9CYAN|nr:thylakoid membrane photosystem I accumulation factor [Aetokthonos hydrillicola]MBO3461491.1 thioredoxin family protein [Aetokthonos hydrillicola CCALA 1050]MBW4584870.1 thylakoid membrane photosystem I accumulation factor [Aetokthonos hydrillicola CCALA 1050]MDR9895419.1 thylakoid membrane photosystem I accumulation factor [Aetokthonos hydrillicola Thurmond2011]